MSDLPTPVPGLGSLACYPLLVWSSDITFIQGTEIRHLYLSTSCPHGRIPRIIANVLGVSASLPESCLLFCCSKYEPLKCKIITQPRHSKKRNVDRMILGENKTALKVARKRQKMNIRTYLLLYWKPESWRPWRLCHQTSSFRISCYSSFMFLSFFILSFYENIRKYLLTINNIIITLTCTNDVNF